MISEHIYLLMEKLDEKDKRRLLRLMRRQMRFLSRRRILKALLWT